MSISWSSRPFDIWDDLTPAPVRCSYLCPCDICTYYTDMVEAQKYEAHEDAMLMEEERERGRKTQD